MDRTAPPAEIGAVSPVDDGRRMTRRLERCTAVFTEGADPTYDCNGLLYVERVAVCTQEKLQDAVAFSCDASVPTSIIRLYRRDAADHYALRVTNGAGGVVVESAGALTYTCREPTSCVCSLARVDVTVD